MTVIEIGAPPWCCVEAIYFRPSHNPPGEGRRDCRSARLDVWALQPLPICLESSKAVVIGVAEASGLALRWIAPLVSTNWSSSAADERSGGSCMCCQGLASLCQSLHDHEAMR